jgi:peptide-methionine (S)-S-oxide reductase
MKKEIATFGMGCFWGPQVLFDDTKGVSKTIVGYMDAPMKGINLPVIGKIGGKAHVEVVWIEFDSDKISYEKLLKIFWKEHDPTQGNRQGVNIGTGYRSAIFYHNDSQKKAALASRKTEQKKIGEKKITTDIVKAGKFYKAEEFHQKYLEQRGRKTC